MDTTFIKDFTVTSEPQSSVKIEGEVPYEYLATFRDAALKAAGKNVEIDGFRKGNVPEKALLEHIGGEVALLGDMAERAIAKLYPEILTTHNIDAIGYPQIAITKIAPENPLGFTATVAILPEIKLPDYQALAKAKNADKPSAAVTDEDIEKQIEDIFRQKAAYERIQKKAAAGAQEDEKPADDLGDAVELPTPESEAKKADEKAADMTDEEAEAAFEMPELTDELVAGLGQPDQFKTVEEFKNKLREHLEIEKARDTDAAHRAALTDEIIEKSEMDLPQTLIDAELGQMQAQMEEDLKRANLKMDDYLEHIKKTKEDMMTEWKPAAEKRAALQLILNEIAKKESITPDQGQLDAQVDQLLEQYKDADESRVRVYVESVMTNEAVMQYLEGQK